MVNQAGTRRKFTIPEPKQIILRDYRPMRESLDLEQHGILRQIGSRVNQLSMRKERKTFHLTLAKRKLTPSQGSSNWTLNGAAPDIHGSEGL
jgi:hypothetical protein